MSLFIIVFITQAYAQKSTRGTLGLLVPLEIGVRGGGRRTPYIVQSRYNQLFHVFAARSRQPGLPILSVRLSTPSNKKVESKQHFRVPF